MNKQINITNNYTCNIQGCTNMGRYHDTDNIGYLFCLEHKKADMVNITHKLCQIENFCVGYAHFGTSLDNQTACRKHKNNLAKQTTQITQPDKCIYQGCTNGSIYNFKGYKT